MTQMIDEIQIPVWTTSGSLRVRKDSLDPEHPDSTYNYILNTLNLTPEDYGYYCTNLTKEQTDLLATIPDDALAREVRYREAKYLYD